MLNKHQYKTRLTLHQNVHARDKVLRQGFITTQEISIINEVIVEINHHSVQRTIRAIFNVTTVNSTVTTNHSVEIRLETLNKYHSKPRDSIKVQLALTVRKRATELKRAGNGHMIRWSQVITPM